MKAIWSYYPEGYVISYVEIENDKPVVRLKIDMNDRDGGVVEVSKRSFNLPKSMWEEDKARKVSELKSETKQRFIKRIFTKL